MVSICCWGSNHVPFVWLSLHSESPILHLSSHLLEVTVPMHCSLRSHSVPHGLESSSLLLAKLSGAEQIFKMAEEKKIREQLWGWLTKVTLPCKEQHGPCFVLVLVHLQLGLSVVISLVWLRNTGGKGLLIPSINEIKSSGGSRARTAS